MVANSSHVHVRQALEGHGFALLPGFMKGASTEDVARLLGRPEAVGHRDLVQVLRVRASADAPINTYSGAYGIARFPLHTDLAHWHSPPRYFLLRAIVGSQNVATPLLNAKSILSLVRTSVLARGLMRPRRPNAGQLPLLPLYQPTADGGWMVRWDERYILPASAAGTAAQEAMAEAICALTPHQVFLQSDGDTLIIDNWRVLHGRGDVPESARDRVVERCYLEELF